MEVELDENGSPQKISDVYVTVMRYYNNRTRDEPYIAAEFRVEDFDKYEHFTVGGRESSGKHVLMKSIHE